MLDYVRLVARRIAQLRLAQTAASLASLTLLALVPMLSMGFWVLALSPSFGRLRDVFLRLLEQFMLPTVSSTVVKYLNQFATRGAELPVVGVLGFLITAVIALSTVEKTIHLIWQQPNRRSWWRRLFLYLVILAGGPLLIATGFALTVGLGSPLVDWVIQALTDTRQERRELGSFLNLLWPFSLSWLALTWAYRMVPSVPVRWLAALLGGFICTILLSVLKIALAWYFTAFPSFKTVYGTLATLPILILWLNAMWLVILIGAIIVASIEGFHDDRISRRWLPISGQGSQFSKVFSGSELFDLALALRDELLRLSAGLHESNHEPVSTAARRNWHLLVHLNALKTVNSTTALYLVEFLNQGRFLQMGVTPGLPFNQVRTGTDGLLIRWNRDSAPAEKAQELQQLRDFIWNGQIDYAVLKSNLGRV